LVFGHVGVVGVRRLFAFASFVMIGSLGAAASPAMVAGVGMQSVHTVETRVADSEANKPNKCKKKSARKCKKKAEQAVATAAGVTYARTKSGTSSIAKAVAPEVAICDRPGASAATQTLANPYLIGGDPNLAVPLTFLVKQKKGDWLQVFLPGPPSGSTGWINNRDFLVSQIPNRYRIHVELGKHRATVYDGANILLQEPAAVGAPATPTPTGVFYLVFLLKAPDPTTEYGPYSYALNAFDVGGQQLSFHGTNDPSALGTDSTLGAVRISNDGITKLSGLVPLGTPVEIVP